MTGVSINWIAILPQIILAATGCHASHLLRTAGRAGGGLLALACWIACGNDRGRDDALRAAGVAGSVAVDGISRSLTCSSPSPRS
jgi:hypothetical protein